MQCGSATDPADRPQQRLSCCNSTVSDRFSIRRMGLSKDSIETASLDTGAQHVHTQQGLDRWRLPYTAGPLTEEEIASYWRDGFLIKAGLLSEELLQSARDAVDAEVDVVAEALFKAGKIQDSCRTAGFRTRLAQIEAQYPSASVLLHKRGILPEAFSQLWSSDNLSSAVR